MNRCRICTITDFTREILRKWRQKRRHRDGGRGGDEGDDGAPHEVYRPRYSPPTPSSKPTTKMIRLATKNDLADICRVHAACFSDSFSSQLTKFPSALWGGSNLLLRYYEEFMADAPELFHVSCAEDGSITGFCMGYYMNDHRQSARFIQRNRMNLCWKTILLLSTLNVPTWKKILNSLKSRGKSSRWTRVNDKFTGVPKDRQGDLLSVCVLPGCRGNGYAQQLMDTFLSAMQANGLELCSLSVKTKNSRARRFYERNGFEVDWTRGDEELIYSKLLK